MTTISHDDHCACPDCIREYPNMKPHIDGCICYWCNEHRTIDAKRKIAEAAKDLQAQLDMANAELESAKREMQIYQGTALYWRQEYDKAIAERNDPNDEEVHRLTVTCHVLARMLASAYDTE